MHEILIVRMVFFVVFFNFRKTKDGGTFKKMTSGESN